MFQEASASTDDLFAGAPCKVADLNYVLTDTFCGVTIAGKGSKKLKNLRAAWGPILNATGFTFPELVAFYPTAASRRRLLEEHGILSMGCRPDALPDLTEVTT